MAASRSSRCCPCNSNRAKCPRCHCWKLAPLAVLVREVLVRTLLDQVQACLRCRHVATCLIKIRMTSPPLTLTFALLRSPLSRPPSPLKLFCLLKSAFPGFSLSAPGPSSLPCSKGCDLEFSPLLSRQWSLGPRIERPVPSSSCSLNASSFSLPTGCIAGAMTFLLLSRKESGAGVMGIISHYGLQLWIADLISLFPPPALPSLKLARLVVQ